MNEDTIIYVSPETYLHDLNSDQYIWGTLAEDQMKFLDEAFLNLSDTEKCKNLVSSYVLTLVKEGQKKERKKYCCEKKALK